MLMPLGKREVGTMGGGGWEVNKKQDCLQNV